MIKEDLFQFPNAKWALPFFAAHTDFSFRFVDLLRNETGNYSFIHNVYGSPACKMNGGHAGRNIRQEDVLSELDEWNKRGISVWLTFSNYLATVQDLKNDFLSKSLLEKADSNNIKFGTKNSVILASIDLIKYIRFVYPTLELISSVVMQARNNTSYSKQLYNDLFKDFDKVCFSYHHNNHVKDFINDFSNKSDRCEILVNNICNLKCKMISKCYEWQSRKSLGLEINTNDDIIGPACPSTIYRKQNKLTPIDESTVLTFNQVKELADNGFILKLASRAYNINAFKNMVYGWMININYRDIIENVLYGLEDKSLYPE